MDPFQIITLISVGMLLMIETAKLIKKTKIKSSCMSLETNYNEYNDSEKVKRRNTKK